MNYLEYLECFYSHIENIKKKYLKKFNSSLLLLLSLEVGTSKKKMHVGGPGDFGS